MKAPKLLQELVAQVLEEYPQAQLGFDPFPSGVCVLNVWLGRRNFELEYDPARGTGVSENKDDTAPFIGHEAAFSSLEEAIQRLKQLLSDAAKTEAEHLPTALAMREKPPLWRS